MEKRSLPKEETLGYHFSLPLKVFSIAFQSLDVFSKLITVKSDYVFCSYRKAIRAVKSDSQREDIREVQSDNQREDIRAVKSDKQREDIRAVKSDNQKEDVRLIAVKSDTAQREDIKASAKR